uniref:AAA+ ATPase domain-containing protein n=2 Tax=Arion vulgaris TaxID=1028688 RepID=A0A0B7ARL7_9EUPU
MAPKKKDKGKLSDWMQCSLCEKLVSSQDAEAHNKSCDSNHGHIKGKVFHGKVIRAEKYLNEDGSCITQNIRDKDSVIWLAVPTMQICGLSIGQPCVVNRRIVKRAWPLKQLPLSNVALTALCLDELGTKDEDIITVERFVPNDYIVQSAVLQLREPNDVFESSEFLSFAVSYLDGKYITEKTPLTVRYFGQVCHCHVNSMTYEMLSIFGRTTQVQVSSPSKSVEIPLNLLVKTPTLQTPQRSIVTDARSSMEGDTSHNNNGDTLSTSYQDLSDSVADLDISSLTISHVTSMTPVLARDTFPNLFTPIKHSKEHTDFNTVSCNAFAKVSSKFTTLSVLPTLRPGHDDQNKAHLTLNDIGGLKSQIEELKTRIARALQPRCVNRCILLHGSAGTGKSSLIKALTLELGINIVHIAGTDIWSKLFGEAESNLRKIFKSAQDKSPSIIVIDDIDVICPKRSLNQAGQQENRIVGTLLSLLDDITAAQATSNAVVVIGITSNRDNIDPALRRAGRFGCEVEIGVPTAAQRGEILTILLHRVSHNLTTEDIETVAKNAHGYVGADLCAVVNEACMQSLRRQTVLTPSVTLILNDLVHAGLCVKPSALREIQLEVPQVKWTDIGGMSDVKMRLIEAVELPLNNPEVFRRLGIQPPRGLLMYGPPGCSKTMVARALATECKLNFLAVKGPEIFNQYVGESEKAIREVFRKARSAAPSIIFFDEIDSIAAKRGSSGGGSGVEDRVLTQLLTEMDGLEFLKDVFIIAATNRPDKIDRALLRPGRFDSLVYVPLPNADTRREILEKKMNKMSVAQDVSLEILVDLTHNYSGAEVGIQHLEYVIS